MALTAGVQVKLSDLQPGLYTAIIVGRTATAPAPADEVSYTIAINVEGGSITFDSVKSQTGARWTDYMEPTGPDDDTIPRIHPFPLGHRVPVHFDRQGDEIILFIDRGEVPEFGGCE